MAEFHIPPKENRTKQILASVIVLLVVSVVVSLLAKLLVGVIIFLLGAIAGIGGRAYFSKTDNQ